MSDQQAEALRLSEQKRRAAQQEYAEKQKAKQEADKARSDALMAQTFEDLRRESEERSTALQEVRDKLNQRIQLAYQGWSKVPAGLCTRAQLTREGLHLPEGVEPVAEVFGYRPKQRGHVIYELYRREDAVAHASQRGDHGFAAGRNRKSELGT